MAATSSSDAEDTELAPGAPAPAAPAGPVPVLPLNDLVLFPGMIAPLTVNTERSLRLVEATAAGDRRLAAVLQRDARQADDAVGPPDLHGLGCLARLLKRLRFPDGSARVLVQGEARFALGPFAAGGEFLRARGTIVADEGETSLEMEALGRHVSQRFQDVIALSPTLPEELRVALFNTGDPARLSDLVAANLPMSLRERQSVLEERRVRARLEALARILDREYRVLELGNAIQHQVGEAVGRNQREYYLREQLRVIRKELGEPDPQALDEEDLRERIEKAGLSAEARAVAEKEARRLQAVPSASPEFGVIRTYLDWLLEMPWRTHTPDRLDLARARRVLDRDHYDLRKVKDRILEYLAVLKLKRDMKGPILCFVGPPGVGKTSLGRSIAAALDRRFTRMSLGGVRDEAEIRGHRRTYIGAMPGRIVQGLKRCGTANPVFMLDEIDKLGTDFRGDPAAALLEVLDPEQHHAFVDHYLDVAFDLSRVLFITTANVLDPVPPALRDRMEVIELPGYTLQEKTRIARRHLVPKQLRAHGLAADRLRFPDESLAALAAEYTREAGVRQLEREIANVCRKTALRVAEGRRTARAISPGRVRTLLGPRRFTPEARERTAAPGVATGLAWTPAGGDLLFVEVSRMPGKGRLTLTGSLGDVMKESAMAALSYIRAHDRPDGPAQALAERTDLHVHVPAGAIPKDGPSAGLAVAVALASLLRDVPVPVDLAMTGEITLRGRVLPVGGIKEKVLAAARAGIRRVVLPLRNRPDLADVPPEAARAIEFRFAGTVDAALRLALGPAAPRRRRKPGRQRSAS